MKYSILVNTSDGFEDCWDPFFNFLVCFWKGEMPQIWLNTEYKEYSFRSLPIKCSKSNSKNLEKRLTWSQCLINALEMIDTEFVLYLQEDYFIEANVNVALIEEMVEKMEHEPEIKYIGLTHFGNYPPFKPCNSDLRLVEISAESRYRISTQAGLWRRDTFLSYLRPEENGWMFEIFGTRRAKIRNEKFLTLNRDIFNAESFPVLLYEHTGIIKGKWHHKMPELFRKHQIQIDFDKRGIYKNKFWLFRKLETGLKLLKNPFLFYKGFFGK